MLELFPVQDGNAFHNLAPALEKGVKMGLQS